MFSHKSHFPADQNLEQGSCPPSPATDANRTPSGLLIHISAQTLHCTQQLSRGVNPKKTDTASQRFHECCFNTTAPVHYTEVNKKTFSTL